MYVCVLSIGLPYGKEDAMCDHVMIPIDPLPLVKQIDPPSNMIPIDPPPLVKQIDPFPNMIPIDPPPLVRQNAFTPHEWKKLIPVPKPPAPSEAFLLQKWDIEKGRF